MKISIITVNLNNINGLKDTFNSVVCQSFKDFEFIIIDGNSNDGSKDFIVKNSQYLSYWRSEKDRGIYDAMNIGIKNATGDYLYFLNSGDILFNSNCLEIIEKELTADLVSGNLEVVTPLSKTINIPPNNLTFDFFVKNNLPHQATFIKRETLISYGLYDTRLKICADWVFFIDAIFELNKAYKHISVTVGTFNAEGISSLSENKEIIANERDSHLKNKYHSFLIDYRGNELIISKYNALKKSRIRKFLSIFFPQLKM